MNKYIGHDYSSQQLSHLQIVLTLKTLAVFHLKKKIHPLYGYESRLELGT